MKFCAHCGAELVKDAKFCVYCGNEIKILEEQPEKIFTTVVNEPEKEAVNESEGKAQNEAEKSAPESQQAYTEPKEQVSGADAIPSMVFGILSVIFSFFCMYFVVGFVFMGLSIAFVCAAKSIRRRFVRVYGMDNGFSRAGSITSTVAIPLLSFFSFIGTLFTLAVIFAE
jgi:hypothetical protein